MICSVPKCGEESGSHVICPFHRKSFRRLSKTRQRSILALWHDFVCEKGQQPDGRYECFHCERYFDREEVCGDHWPKSKGASPQTKFDVEAGVPCCKDCNRSDNPARFSHDELSRV